MGACDPCNDWCEENPDLAVSMGLVVRSWEDPKEIYVKRMRTEL